MKENKQIRYFKLRDGFNNLKIKTEKNFKPKLVILVILTGNQLVTEPDQK